jgi:hypothetical protein
MGRGCGVFLQADANLGVFAVPPQGQTFTSANNPMVPYPTRMSMEMPRVAGRSPGGY